MKHSQRFIFVEWQNTEAMATTTYYSLTFLSIPISNAMQMEDMGKKTRCKWNNSTIGPKSQPK